MTLACAGGHHKMIIISKDFKLLIRFKNFSSKNIQNIRRHDALFGIICGSIILILLYVTYLPPLPIHWSLSPMNFN